MEQLLELYKNWKGSNPSNVEKLAGAGSNREYYRMFDEDGDTVIGVIGTSRDEIMPLSILLNISKNDVYQYHIS